MGESEKHINDLKLWMALKSLTNDSAEATDYLRLDIV